MNTSLLRRLGVALLMLMGPSALAQLAPQPSALLAEHRSGQTFITFTEAVDPTVDHFRVYRSDQPIDAQSLPQATLLDELWPGSGEFHADRYYKSTTAVWQKRYLTRYVIVNGGPELAAGTGLLVLTLHGEDLGGGTSGSGYYAVTSVDPLGVENQVDFSAANSVGPVGEQIDPPSPVLCQILVNNQIYIYTQFLDRRKFNPTFSAPNAHNQYYGLDPQEPTFPHSLQYAYTYALALPQDQGCALQEQGGARGVALVLHGFSGLLARPLTYIPDPTWCNAFRIYPIDPGNTWWFGCSKDHDYRIDLQVPAGEVIENFTEQRIIRMIEDLKRDPTFGPQVDPERIFVTGHSMGGSGTVALALRYPRYFSAAHASQPMTDYKTSGDGGGSSWKSDVEIKWGQIANQNPIDNEGEPEIAGHLNVFDGTPAFEWADHQQNLVDRRGDEFVPLGIDHGLIDTTIEWSTQGQPAYEKFDAASMCWSGDVLNTDHIQSMLSLLPGALQKLSGIPFHGFEAVSKETVPGFSGGSENLSIPPTQVGSFNRNLDWSASWNNWDGVPVDQANVWQVSLRAEDLLVQFTDVTPRRCQQFQVVPGKSYRYRVTRIADSAVLDTDLLMADADGLLTVPNVEVDATGVRVRIETLLNGDLSSISVSAGGTQSLALRTSSGFAGDLYWVLGSASGTTPGLMIDGLLLSLAYDPYFEYTLSTPNSQILSNGLGTLDANGEADISFNFPLGLGAGLVGVEGNHAALVFDTTGLVSAVLVTDPVPVLLTP